MKQRIPDRADGPENRVVVESRPVLLAGAGQLAPDDQDGGERDEDPELRLDDRRDRCQDRSGNVVAPPETPDGEEEDERPHRIDLGPDRAVDPGDRYRHHESGRKERPPPAPAEIRDQDEDHHRETRVGEHRRDLQEVPRCGVRDPRERPLMAPSAHRT